MIRTFLLPLLAWACLSSGAHGQGSADRPVSAPATEASPAHEMKNMGGMMAGMRRPVCVYESKGYSPGALLKVPGTSMMLVCDAAGSVAVNPHDHSASSARPGAEASTLAWQVYRPGKDKVSAAKRP